MKIKYSLTKMDLVREQLEKVMMFALVGFPVLCFYLYDSFYLFDSSALDLVQHHPLRRMTVIFWVLAITTIFVIFASLKALPYFKKMVGEHVVELLEEGIQHKSPKAESFYVWADINTVHKGFLIWLYMKNKAVILIPLEAFFRKIDEDKFLHFIEMRTGK